MAKGNSLIAEPIIDIIAPPITMGSQRREIRANVKLKAKVAILSGMPCNKYKKLLILTSSLYKKY